eukprot:31126-Pelagococcus_subviridis.AAC.17
MSPYVRRRRRPPHRWMMQAHERGRRDIVATCRVVRGEVHQRARAAPAFGSELYPRARHSRLRGGAGEATNAIDSIRVVPRPARAADFPPSSPAAP